MNDQRHRPAQRSTSAGARPARPAAYRPVRSPLMSMGPSLDDERRRHRMARLIAVTSVVAVVAVVLLVWVIGLLGREVVSTERGDAKAQSARGTVAPAVQQAGPPDPQTLAEAVVDPDAIGLRLQLPIRREAVTGIGYAPRRERGVIELDPAGTRANTSWLRRTTQRFLSVEPAGDLSWYRLRDGVPSMVTVGAAPGTSVYAPIDGSVEAISDYVVSGVQRGSLIELQPVGDSQTIVIIRNLTAAADLQVGTTVSQSVTRLGSVLDMEGALEAPLADYTHDSGSGIDMYVLRTDVSRASS